MDYTTISLAEVSKGLQDVASDAQATFGALDARQLNWRPNPEQWSVAQCFEHLLTANRLMLVQADDALSDAHRRTIWQRLPVLPGFFGKMLIRSQTPGAERKFKAPPKARPAASDVAADVIQRFVEQQREFTGRVRTLDEQRAARAIMASPFLKIITYSVLDGWRLMVAHNRRHFEQARRVTQAPAFPK